MSPLLQALITLHALKPFYPLFEGLAGAKASPEVEILWRGSRDQVCFGASSFAISVSSAIQLPIVAATAFLLQSFNVILLTGSQTDRSCLLLRISVPFRELVHPGTLATSRLLAGVESVLRKRVELSSLAIQKGIAPRQRRHHQRTHPRSVVVVDVGGVSKELVTTFS